MKLQIFTLRNLDSNHFCLAVISLESALKKHENYYRPVFLKCKYIGKKPLDIVLMT